MKKILIYSSKKEKIAQIAGVCDVLEIELHELTHSELSDNIGALLGVPMGERGKPLPPLYVHSDIMIINGLTDQELDIFLAEYKREGIEPIALKAVATPHNVTLTVHELAEELLKEVMR